MVLEPMRPFQQANALSARIVVQLAVQGAESEHAGEGQLALGAPGLLLEDGPVQQAAGCRTEYTKQIIPSW